MNTNQKGKITEIEVLSYITKLGYSVSIPFGDKDRYDQIWDIDGKLLKIQIKTSHWKNDKHNAFTFKCKTTSNGKEYRYTEKDIDFFATIWEDKCYLIPVKECSTEKTLWITQGVGYNKNCRMASEYVVEEVLKSI